MKSIRINDADISDLRISSLPSRPTAPRAFGGYGYTATEMKAAFDKLPLYIVEKFNSLLDCITGSGDDSIPSYIHTGINSTHMLSDLFDDILSGVFATYLSVSGVSLSESVLGMKAQINQCLTFDVTQNSKLNSHDESIVTHTAELRSVEDRVAANESAISMLNVKIGALSGGDGSDTENISIDCGSPADLVN